MKGTGCNVAFLLALLSAVSMVSFGMGSVAARSGAELAVAFSGWVIMAIGMAGVVTLTAVRLLTGDLNAD